MDTYPMVRWLIGLCRRHALLEGFLEPLYRHAEQRGYKPLLREHGELLLERAHVARLTGGEEAQALAVRAMDRFERLAGHGDPDAAFHLAEAHRTGFGRPRNHWKALEHYQVASDLGHAGAPRRLKQLQDGEPVTDDGAEAFGRRALLKATYARGRSHRQLAARVRTGLREARQEGVGLAGTLLILLAAGLLLGYLALDLYFFGMGAWRPDPGRVVWGMFGKIHPPEDPGARRVLPAWARPDVGSVGFTLTHIVRDGQDGHFTLADYRGKVVFLCVVEGNHPALQESQDYLRGLADRHDPRFQFLVLYLPGLEDRTAATGWFQYAFFFTPGIADGPRALRPLGAIHAFPSFFVLDRRGRVRQRWAGWSEALSREAIKAALEES